MQFKFKVPHYEVLEKFGQEILYNNENKTDLIRKNVAYGILEAINFCNFYEPILTSPKINQFRHEIKMANSVVPKQIEKITKNKSTAESWSKTFKSMNDLDELLKEFQDKQKLIEERWPFVKDILKEYVEEV